MEYPCVTLVWVQQRLCSGNRKRYRDMETRLGCVELNYGKLARILLEFSWIIWYRYTFWDGWVYRCIYVYVLTNVNINYPHGVTHNSGHAIHGKWTHNPSNSLSLSSRFDSLEYTLLVHHLLPLSIYLSLSLSLTLSSDICAPSAESRA